MLTARLCSQQKEEDDGEKQVKKKKYFWLSKYKKKIQYSPFCNERKDRYEGKHKYMLV